MKKQMMKRFCALLLAFVMVFTMCDVSAFAAGSEQTVSETSTMQVESAQNADTSAQDESAQNAATSTQNESTQNAATSTQEKSALETQTASIDAEGIPVESEASSDAVKNADEEIKEKKETTQTDSADSAKISLASDSEEETENGTETESEAAQVTPSTSLSGNGAEDDPYLVSSEADLLYMVSLGTDTTIGGYYELQNDIELTTADWTPIGGNSYKNFVGHFDGKGHTISGLKIGTNTLTYTGLFGYNAGTIMNLKVEGDVVGYLRASVLCGYNAGTISGCTAAGSITISATNDGSAGGLTGQNAGTVKDSFSSVSVTNTGNIYIGSAVGVNDGTVTTTGATGNVTGHYRSMGGFVGLNRGPISNCYARGTVLSDYEEQAGGFAGRNTSTIKYCYATGMVNNNTGAGFSQSNSVQPLFCYYNSANTGVKAGYALTLAEMKAESSFGGFDFDNIWTLDTESGYPEPTKGNTSEKPAIEGEGTEESPYLIKTEAQLTALAKGQYPLSTKTYYSLQNDITLTAKHWTPIGGNGNDNFAGVFNGNGYTIKGLAIGTNTLDYTGLFGYNAGTIMNLNVEGNVVGYLRASVLCGFNAGTISGCSAAGSITISTTNDGSAGGLTGDNTGTVKDSLSTVSVTNTGNIYIGSAVGINDGTVTTTGATGNVTGHYRSMGGFVGLNRGPISNCYARGTVLSDYEEQAGGFVGRNTSTIKYCYATGMVNNNTGAGFSQSNSVQPDFCYFNAANTGNKVAFSVAKSLMKQENTYTGFDFDNIWTLDTQSGYPEPTKGGTSEVPTIEGDGSEENPYLITNEAQLIALAKGQLPLTGKNYYALANDIELESYRWTPIGGNNSSNFEGFFDGNGHTVSGLNIESCGLTYYGLFGKSTGTIKNLTVEGSVKVNSFAGILCGFSNGTLINCHTSGTVSGTENAGGLVGRCEGGTITNCSSDATVSATDTAGGLMGYSSAATYKTCFATGNVTSTGNTAGGLAGRLVTTTLEYCYARGNVVSGNNSYAGGLVGNFSSGTVTNCYSTGKSNEGNGGGLIGNKGGTVTGSYYCSETSFCTDTTKGTPLTKAQMRSEDSFEDWDFAETMGIHTTENNGYPFCLWQLSDSSEETTIPGFRYNVKETRKGYASVGQTMQFILETADTSTVTLTIVYKEDDTTKNTTLDMTYDAELTAFTADFALTEGMQQITSATASITDAGGNTTTQGFKNSYEYQMPLYIEGILNVNLTSDVAGNTAMSLNLVNSEGNTVRKIGMKNQNPVAIDGLAEDTYTVKILGAGYTYAQKDIQVESGKTVSLDMTDLTPVASVVMEYYCDGVKLDEPDLAVAFTDATEGKSRALGTGSSLNCLAQGDKITYVLSLTKALKQTYKTDATVHQATLEAGINVIRVDVEKFILQDVTLHVVNEATGNGVGDAAVTVAQSRNDIYPYKVSGSTDTDGNVTLQLVDTDATVTVTKRSYNNYKESLTLEELTSGSPIKLEPVSGIVEFSIGYPGVTTKDQTFKPDSVVVTRDKTGEKVSLNTSSWPETYAKGTDWQEGETFTAVLKEGDYSDLTLTAQVNAYGNLRFIGSFVGLGNLTVNLTREAARAGTKADAVLFDADGNKAASGYTAGDSVTLSNLKAGDYTLAVAESSTKLKQYSNIAFIKNDYVNYVKVTVYDGQDMSEDVIVPNATAYNALLNKDGSSFGTNVSYAIIGDYIHVRAEYALTDKEDCYSLKAVLSIPEGTSLKEDAVTVDGETAKPTVGENSFTVAFPATASIVSKRQNSVVVRYTVKVLTTVTTSDLQFTGSLQYGFENATNTELLGTASVNLDALTIQAPTVVTKREITVHGVAAKNTKVSVYDGDVLIGETTSGKHGYYTANVTLDGTKEGTIHKLKAVQISAKTNEAEESTALDVQYGSEVPVQTRFAISCNAHEDVVYVFNNMDTERPTLTFTYNPAYPVTLIVGFDDNTGVTDVVEYVQTSDGESYEVPLYYDEVNDDFEGTFTATGCTVITGFSCDYKPVKMKTIVKDVYEGVFDGAVADYSELEQSGNVYTTVAEVTLADADKSVVDMIQQVEVDLDYTPSSDDIVTKVGDNDAYLQSVTGKITYNGEIFTVDNFYVKQDNGKFLRYSVGEATGTVDESEEETTNSAAKSGSGISLAASKKTTTKAPKTSEGASDTATIMGDMLSEYAASDSCPSGSKDYYNTLADVSTQYNDICNLGYEGINMTNSSTSASNSAPPTDVWDLVDNYISGKAEDLMNSMADAAANQYDKYASDMFENAMKDSGFVEWLLSGDSPYGNIPWWRWGLKKKLRDYLDSLSVNTILDPSGYVYETTTGNRLEGVTATLYYENDEGQMEVWDAEEYNQTNPLVTDAEGLYAWDVPEGIWQVKYEKEGYETVWSDKMEVPPPQLDVNIAMVSTKGAQIQSLSGNYNRINITFDKYVTKASLTADKFTLSLGGTTVNATLEIPDNAVETYDGQEVVKTVSLVLKSGKLQNGTYSVAVAAGLQTYAGVGCDAMTGSYLVNEEADAETGYTLTVPEHVTVMRGDEKLSDGAVIYSNDRLLIIAEAVSLYELKSLTANGDAIENGSYYTVTDANVVLEASYESTLGQLTVTFDAKGGSAVAAKSGITAGTHISKPEDPVRNGYNFLGWYTEPDGSTAFDFDNDTVKDNMILYAKWEKEAKGLGEQQIAGSESYERTLAEGAFSLDAELIAGDGTLSYTSADENVATVNSYGRVKPVGVGETTITVNAAATDEYKAASFEVTVKVTDSAAEITGTESYEKTVGDVSFMLDAELTAGDGTLEYASDNTDVITVAANGRVKIVGAGKAVITVSSKATKAYRAASLQINVLVKEAEDARQEQKLTGTTAYNKTLADGIFMLDAELTEGNGRLCYTSSDESVVTVSSDGYVKLKGTGKAKVTVTAVETENFKTASMDIEINVTKAESKLTGSESLTLKQDDNQMLDTELTEGDGTVAFTSSDPEVVRVTAGGRVYAVSEGTATIHAEASETARYLGTYMDITVTVPHEHSFTQTTVVPATMAADGKLIPTCSCGAQDEDNIKVITRIASVKVNTTAYVYDGKAKKTGVTVKDASGVTLGAAAYTLTYKNNTNVGKGSVTITFTGNYEGGTTLNFAINPKPTTLSKVTAAKKGFKATWKKQAVQTTGYELQYSTSAKFTGAKSILVTKNTITSKSVSKLSAKKKYYIRIRTYKTVSNVKYYSAWSKALNVTTKK